MNVYFSILFFILGTIFGSFYNVVGYRLPRGESLLFPSSHCTNCNHKLGPLELIPVFSYTAPITRSTLSSVTAPEFATILIVALPFDISPSGAGLHEVTKRRIAIITVKIILLCFIYLFCLPFLTKIKISLFQNTIHKSHIIGSSVYTRTAFTDN